MPPDRVPPPPAQMLQMVTGRWVSSAVGVAAKHDYATLLAAGPRTVQDLAGQVGADPTSVFRLLRALASLGVFAETTPGTFVNTPLSETIRSDIPTSVRPLALLFSHDVHVNAWRGLTNSVETGSCGFEYIHGEQPWRYMAKDREFARVFNDAMTAMSGQIAHAVVAAYDFAGIDELVDVGGGHGYLLTAILAANPSIRGVLFDLPAVVEGAGPVVKASGAAARVRIEGGDFFEQVPEAGAYLMKHILHDWSDADATRILQTIHRAATPGARLLIVESVLRPGNEPDLGKILDLEMLVVTLGGRERTLEDWTQLLAGAGFRLERVVPTESMSSVIETRAQ